MKENTVKIVPDMDVMACLDSDVAPKRCSEGHWCCDRSGDHMHVAESPKACDRCRDRLAVEVG